MPTIKVEIYPEYIQMYRDAHYPLGKSIRGFKKWIKRRMIQALKYWKDEGYKQLQRFL